MSMDFTREMCSAKRRTIFDDEQVVELSMSSEESQCPPKRSRRSKVYKTLSQNKYPSVFRICRNPATGYHYEVPSCNKCKTFFRRTLITGSEFHCDSGNKCLDANGVNEISIAPLLYPFVLLINRPTEDDSYAMIIRKLTLIESRIEPLHRSGLPPGYRDVRKLRDILDSRPVLVANEIPNLQFFPSNSGQMGGQRKRCTNYVYSSFLASVESSKMFDFFSQMDLDKKVLLMKHATIICANMMNAFFSIHQMKSDVLLHPDGSVAGPPSENRRRLLQKTLVAFLSNKIDRTEYLLFKAIMLCTPAVPGLSVLDQTIIEKERNEFVRALLNYCLLQHGRLHGPARFSTIISLAPTIERQAKGQKDIHLYVKSGHFQRKIRGESVRECICTMFDQVMED